MINPGHLAHSEQFDKLPRGGEGAQLGGRKGVPQQSHAGSTQGVQANGPDLAGGGVSAGRGGFADPRGERLRPRFPGTAGKRAQLLDCKSSAIVSPSPPSRLHGRTRGSSPGVPPAGGSPAPQTKTEPVSWWNALKGIQKAFIAVCSKRNESRNSRIIVSVPFGLH